MKKGIIFDMDGVIIDNGTAHDEAWKMFCKKYNVTLTDEELRKNLHGRANKDILKYLLKKKMEESNIKEYEDEKERMYRDFYRNEIKEAEGLIDFLKFLKEKEIKIGIATSSPVENIDFIMDSLNIRDFFDFIVNSAMVKRGKPFPDIYLKSVEKIGLNREECVVFEDSLSGIEAAHMAGIDVIGVTTANKEEEMKNIVFAVKNFKSEIEKIKNYIIL